MTNVTAEEVEQLTGAVETIEDVLRMLVQDQRDRALHEPQPYDEEYEAHLERAWGDVSNRFDDVKERIEALRADVDEGPSAPERERPQGSKLKEHGLLGPELRLKHYVIKWLAEQIRGSRTGPWMRRFLKAANSFLGSLSEAIPGAGAIAEFKDILEAMMTPEPQG